MCVSNARPTSSNSIDIVVSGFVRFEAVYPNSRQATQVPREAMHVPHAVQRNPAPDRRDGNVGLGRRVAVAGDPEKGRGMEYHLGMLNTNTTIELAD